MAENERPDLGTTRRRWIQGTLTTLGLGVLVAPNIRKHFRDVNVQDGPRLEGILNSDGSIPNDLTTRTLIRTLFDNGNVKINIGDGAHYQIGLMVHLASEIIPVLGEKAKEQGKKPVFYDESPKSRQQIFDALNSGKETFEEFAKVKGKISLPLASPTFRKRAEQAFLELLRSAHHHKARINYIDVDTSLEFAEEIGNAHRRLAELLLFSYKGPMQEYEDKLKKAMEIYENLIATRMAASNRPWAVHVKDDFDPEKELAISWTGYGHLNRKNDLDDLQHTPTVALVPSYKYIGPPKIISGKEANEINFPETDSADFAVLIVKDEILGDLEENRAKLQKYAKKADLFYLNEALILSNSWNREASEFVFYVDSAKARQSLFDKAMALYDAKDFGGLLEELHRVKEKFGRVFSPELQRDEYYPHIIGQGIDTAIAIADTLKSKEQNLKTVREEASKGQQPSRP